MAQFARNPAICPPSSGGSLCADWWLTLLQIGGSLWCRLVIRQQGNLLEGVIVYKTITVKMVATEPNFEKTLKWLDPKNEDDRIIASALQIQVQNPSDKVVLVTSDINLQNKAQLACLTFADTDDLE